jgi:hypothetical protein
MVGALFKTLRFRLSTTLLHPKLDCPTVVKHLQALASPECGYVQGLRPCHWLRYTFPAQAPRGHCWCDRRRPEVG